MTKRHMFIEGDRYLFDFDICHYKKGWAQVDTSQDAWYFGAWANPTSLQLLSYAEGDVTLQTADTEEEFVEMLRSLQQWNEEHGHSFLGIDPMCDEGLKGRFEALGLADLLH